MEPSGSNVPNSTPLETAGFFALVCRSGILTKVLVRSENNIFAVLSLKSADGKMTARNRLEVVDKCIVDGSASERANDRDGLRCSLL